MTLTKQHIIHRISTISGIPKTKSAQLFESMLETMKSSLEFGDDILISGFGKFSVKNKNKRRGRNPATGSKLILGARRVVTFRCSPVLKGRLNATDKT